MGHDNRKFSTVQHYAISHQGKVRKENQDAYGVFQNSLSDNSWSVYVVCDGMGGAKGGRVASALCLEAISKILKDIESPTIDDLVETIVKANKALFWHSKNDADLQGMGTTLVLFASLDSGCYSIHVGDSRLYRLRDNKLQILTRDHTYAQELIDSGTLSESSAKRSPISHLLTKAIGTEPKISPEVAKLEDISEGDIYLLSSDGLYAHLNRLNIEELILECLKDRNLKSDTKQLLEKITHTLIDETLSAGANDNTTILTLKSDKNAFISTEYHSQVSSVSGIDLDLKIFEENNEDSDLEESSISDAILHSASKAAEHTHESRSNAGTLFVSFLLGISLVLGLALWALVSSEGPSHTTERRISSKLNSAIQKIIEERALSNSKDRIYILDNPVLTDPLRSYGFMEEKYFEILAIPEKAPLITIEDEVIDEELNLEPIEWKEEKELVKSVKINLDAIPNSPSQARKPKELGNLEKIDLTNEKNILRESIWDIDLRLTALEISSTVEEETARADIISQKNGIEEDLDLTKMAIASIENRKHSMEAIAQSKSFDIMLSKTKELSRSENNIENLKQRYLTEVESTNFYAGLIKDAKNQLEIANRLASSNRNKKRLESLFRTEIKMVSRDNIEEFNEHIAVLTLLGELLEIESKRTSRALGIVGAYTKMNKDSKISIWESLIQRRNVLYSDYIIMEKSLPSEQELKAQLRFIQVEQERTKE